MKYSSIRHLIKTGDLIAVKKTSGFLPIATRIVTSSPYTHTGIAIWVGKRLLLAQTNSGGCNIVPLSQETAYDFDVFTCPVDRAKCEEVIWAELGTYIPYGVVDLIRIFGFKVFGIPLPKKDGIDLICSALSATIYKKAGWKPYHLPSIPWPGAVVQELANRIKFVVTAS